MQEMFDNNTEPYFVIDFETRTIIVPEELKEIGVALDNNAETIVFQAPKTFDGVDLSTKSGVINCLNANGGYMPSDDVTITTDDEYIYLTWKVSNSLTLYPGTVYISVTFKGSNDDDEDYYLSTQKAQLTVLEGLNDGNSIVGIDIETVSDLLQEVEKLREDVNVLQEKVNSLTSE